LWRSAESSHAGDLLPCGTQLTGCLRLPLLYQAATQPHQINPQSIRCLLQVWKTSREAKSRNIRKKDETAPPQSFPNALSKRTLCNPLTNSSQAPLSSFPKSRTRPAPKSGRCAERRLRSESSRSAVNRSDLRLFAMTDHKFKIGQFVYFHPKRSRLVTVTPSGHGGAQGRSQSRAGAGGARMCVVLAASERQRERRGRAGAEDRRVSCKPYRRLGLFL